MMHDHTYIKHEYINNSPRQHYHFALSWRQHTAWFITTISNPLANKHDGTRSKLPLCSFRHFTFQAQRTSKLKILVHILARSVPLIPPPVHLHKILLHHSLFT